MLTKQEVIQAAADRVITSGNKEQFVIIHEGEYRYCDLKTLNYLANELQEQFKVVASLHQDRITASINPFCKPIITYY